MFNNLFPKVVDNNYTGLSIAKWVLVLIIIKAFVAGSIHMFALDGGAQSIGGIALDKFSQGAADTVVSVFGMWGIEQFMVGLVALIVLLRYKSLIPMIWGIYMIDYGLRLAAPIFTPGIVSYDTPPGVVMDQILFPLAVIMFILSLYSKNKREISK